MNYFCCDERRRTTVAAHATINGIEFLEVVDDPAAPDSVRQRTLLVHFVKNLAPNTLTIENIRIEGGDRVRDIIVTAATAGASGDNKILQIEVNKAGDFSTYTLRLVRADDDARPPENFDAALSVVAFSFKVLCPSDFDCEQARACANESKPPPEIDYLAKDYASFRRLMLDRMAHLLPAWTERNPADPCLALVELLAYIGDYLSYQQDAVGTESYLGTARRRTSVRRHARLVDYHVNDGANARAWLHVNVTNDDVALRKGTQIFTRLPHQENRIAPRSKLYAEAIAARPVVFETMHDATLYESHNEIRFYTWSDERCCLPKGATRATLENEGDRLKVGDHLKIGDVLLFVEMRNPQSGIREEADPSHRHAVRLTKVTLGEDALFTEDEAGTQPLRIAHVEWAAEDRLPFALCLWDVAVGGDAEDKQPASIALGNIVLADHGLSVRGEPIGVVPQANPALARISSESKSFCDEQTIAQTAPRFRPFLRQHPLTHAAPYDTSQRLRPASEAMNQITNELLPAITLRSDLDDVEATWRPRRDLLNSDAGATEFVVETETDGTAFLRFGDDRFGSRPASGTRFAADYRIGNPTAGNVGAHTLAHIVSDDGAITSVTNPMPAHGGTEPESLERIRQNAPSAFRTQERAVTAEDYASVAVRRTDVQRAAATMRWTGSWRTVFVTADRFGGREVDAEFETDMRRFLERFRMAGHDLEVDAPRHVALEIEMTVCVKPDYLRGDVKRALLEKFSSRNLASGGRGAFHPDNFTFGQTVFLSPLYAAAQSVDGVASVVVTRFARRGANTAASLAAIEAGKLEFGRLEIARLDNDPNFAERGVFRLVMKGGR